MSTDALQKVFGETRAIMANVTPDQLDDRTPCASWDVRRLINHIVGGSHWFAITTNAGASPEDDTTEDTDFTADDMVAAYDEGINQSLAAFGAPGAEEKMVKLPFGEFPGGVFMAFATIDHFTHGWDLAKATGQSTDLDPVMASQILDQARMLVPDQLRGPDGVGLFGPIVDVPESTSPANQLAAFLGRTP